MDMFGITDGFLKRLKSIKKSIKTLNWNELNDTGDTGTSMVHVWSISHVSRPMSHLPWKRCLWSQRFGDQRPLVSSPGPQFSCAEASCAPGGLAARPAPQRSYLRSCLRIGWTLLKGFAPTMVKIRRIRMVRMVFQWFGGPTWANPMLKKRGRGEALHHPFRAQKTHLPPGHQVEPWFEALLSAPHAHVLSRSPLSSCGECSPGCGWNPPPWPPQSPKRENSTARSLSQTEAVKVPVETVSWAQGKLWFYGPIELVRV